MQNKNTLFVLVHSLNGSQVLAERHAAKVGGREAMLISFQWTLTIQQILSLADVVSWTRRNQQLQGSCSAHEAQVKPCSDYIKL